jgi:1-acyl-sn-glycerol-3-phosphate acyltransferase
VRIFGAEKAWPRQKKLFRPFPVFVKFGQPIRFELSSEEAKSRDTYLTISREIMRRIAELQPPS